MQEERPVGSEEKGLAVSTNFQENLIKWDMSTSLCVWLLRLGTKQSSGTCRKKRSLTKVWLEGKKKMNN